MVFQILEDMWITEIAKCTCCSVFNRGIWMAANSILTDMKLFCVKMPSTDTLNTFWTLYCPALPYYYHYMPSADRVIIYMCIYIFFSSCQFYFIFYLIYSIRTFYCLLTLSAMSCDKDSWLFWSIRAKELTLSDATSCVWLLLSLNIIRSICVRLLWFYLLQYICLIFSILVNVSVTCIIILQIYINILFQLY